MRREVENEVEFYFEGNAVRKMEAMPDYRQERKRREEREQQEELRRRQRAAYRNRERELRMSRSYVAFLTMAVMVFGIFTGTYVKIQSDVTSRMNTIASLESQIADLRAENDEAFKRINTTVDLDQIKDTAINEFGMFYATEEQIIYYTVENDDYMNQYGAIPNK